jgi:hypothetical protein
MSFQDSFVAYIGNGGYSETAFQGLLPSHVDDLARSTRLSRPLIYGALQAGDVAASGCRLLLELRQRLQLVAFPSSVGLPKLVAPYDLRVESLWRRRCQAGEPAPFRFKRGVYGSATAGIAVSTPIRCASSSRRLRSRHVGDAPPNVPNRAIVPQERRYLAAGTGRPAVSTKQIGRQAY